MMSAPTWRLLVILPWFLLPLFAVGYLRLRASLPAKLVVHFGMDGKPDGWMGRTTFLLFTLILLAAESSIFTLILLPTSSAPKSIFLLLVYYVCMAGGAALSWQLLQYNLTGTPLRWLWLGATALGAALIPATIIWLSMRS